MKQIVINDQVSKAGDFVELTDLVGQAYKQTKNYDINVSEPIEIYKYDQDDFKFVQLIPTKDTQVDNLNGPIIVHKLLSNFQDEIVSLEKDSEGKVLAVTNFLRIELEQALTVGEIRLVEPKPSEQQTEIRFIKSLTEIYEIFSIGLFTPDDLNSLLESQGYHYFQVQKKWKLKYAHSITGKFYIDKNKQKG